MDSFTMEFLLDTINDQTNSKLEEDYWGDIYEKVGGGIPLTKAEVVELETLVHDVTIFKGYKYEGDIDMGHMKEVDIELQNMRSSKLWQAMREEVIMTLDGTQGTIITVVSEGVIDNITDTLVFESDSLWQEINEVISDIIRDKLGEED